MYMYYLLGHRLMEVPIHINRKEVIAKNTFILAIDGDTDFKPEAVLLLLDHMKKDEKLGAVCGRIHPTGSGKIESVIAILWHLCAPQLACSVQFEINWSHGNCACRESIRLQQYNPHFIKRGLVFLH